jgi:prepilin-type N-terminal cleavage/methylation domain-containing protein
MKSIRNNKGFTLIELMIVVVIIGILAAIALPKFTGMTKNAKSSEADPLLKEVYTLQEAYFAKHETYATKAQLVDNGLDDNLTSESVANAQGRYFYIDMSDGTATEFCAAALLTQRGIDAGLTPKNMGSDRILKTASNASTTNCDKRTSGGTTE